MKSYIIILLLMFQYHFVFAQENKLGNIDLDVSLSVINTNAKTDIGAFRSELKLGYHVSDSKLDYMYVKLKMQPSEMFMALEISKYSKRPIDDVLLICQKNKGQGWGLIAKQAGIKPGSKEFQLIKSNAGSKAKKIKGAKGKSGQNAGGKGKNVEKGGKKK